MNGDGVQGFRRVCTPDQVSLRVRRIAPKGKRRKRRGGSAETRYIPPVEWEKKILREGEENQNPKEGDHKARSLAWSSQNKMRR